MPVLSKDLSHPLKHSFLFRVLWYMTQEYAPLRHGVEQVLYRTLQRQHTRRHYSNVIKPCLAQRLWRACQSISVWSGISLSHTKLVCSMSFLAFCFPKWT